jgi:hypothetical protein
MSNVCEVCGTSNLPGDATACADGNCMVCEECMCSKCDEGQMCEKHCGCSQCSECEIELDEDEKYLCNGCVDVFCEEHIKKKEWKKSLSRMFKINK